MRELRPKSWIQLQEMLFESSWNGSIQRFRSDFAYRGLGNADWALKTSLARLGGTFRELEAHLLRNFKKYATQPSVVSRSEWTWLALAQHHGLPTRMLDWTYSPYVALHFATVDTGDYHRDGLIFCANYVRIHELLPARLKQILRRERSNTFTAEMLDGAVSTLGGLERLSRKDFVLFLEPPSLDQRIVNQFALFSMMSRPERHLDDWLRGRDSELAFRVVIPARMKWEIRDKLDQANITERVLFPGLDGLSQWLRRHYMPKPVTRRGADRLGRSGTARPHYKGFEYST